jgi:large conductance mechanosensitive channel
MGILKEFKEFAIKGSVVDLAVGIIIGAAFSRLVSSMVADVIMPPLGLLIGAANFSDLIITLREASGAAPAVIIALGKFIQAVMDFLIVAGAIFLLIKFVNKFKAKEAPGGPIASAQEVLLTEIRDLLRAKN